MSVVTSELRPGPALGRYHILLLPRSGQVQPERPRGADPEATPWCHVPGQKRVVRSGVAQVLSVIVMLIQSVSSAKRKSPCVRGLGSVALGTRVGAAVTLGTGWMNVTVRVDVDGTRAAFRRRKARAVGWCLGLLNQRRDSLALLCHVMQRTDVFQIRIEPELRDRLARLRDERHVNVSAWARDVIAAALDREFPADLEAPTRQPLAGWRPCPQLVESTPRTGATERLPDDADTPTPVIQ